MGYKIFVKYVADFGSQLCVITFSEVISVPVKNLFLKSPVLYTAEFFI